jgi:hypothetical protein
VESASLKEALERASQFIPAKPDRVRIVVEAGMLTLKAWERGHRLEALLVHRTLQMKARGPGFLKGCQSNAGPHGPLAMTKANVRICRSLRGADTYSRMCPCRMPRVTASVRLAAPSFERVAATWNFTVWMLI